MEHFQSVRLFGFRSGPMICLTRSGSKFLQKLTMIKDASNEERVKQLTHLCLMEVHALINRMNPFQIQGLFGSSLQFHPNFKSTFYKQIVQNQIRHCILQCLI